MSKFNAEEFTFFDGLRGYRLSYSGNDERTCSELLINPVGMTVCRYTLGGISYIDTDQKRFESKANYGIPILYPTPNRVTDSKISFEGKEHILTYEGKNVGGHGIARRMMFDIRDLSSDKNEAMISGTVSFTHDSEYFTAFPFENTLTVTIRLHASGFSISYNVENGGEKTPFGFALHPFFYKIGGAENVYVKINSADVMYLSDENIHSGIHADMSGSEADFTEYTPVSQMPERTKKGTVHFSVPSQNSAQIYYSTTGVTFSLCATSELDKIVTFFPQGCDYFCVENQSCAPDGINLESRGVKNGVITLRPFEKFCGGVDFRINIK